MTLAGLLNSFKMETGHYKVKDLWKGWNIQPQSPFHSASTMGEGGEDGDWVQLPVANDLVSYAHVIEPPWNPSQIASGLMSASRC